MITVWKYPFEINDEFSLMVPKGAEFLSVQMQKDQPQIWFLLNSNREKEKRTFRIYGTGHEIKTDRFPCELKHQYRGIIQMHYGNLIWHLFEVL